MTYYRIKGLPGFDGLIAAAHGPLVQVEGKHDCDIYAIDEIINPNVAIGDSTLRWPQEPWSLFISEGHLEPVDFSPREFTADSPFGELSYEGHFSRSNIAVDYAVYANGASVSIKDTSVSPVRTIYSQNFFGRRAGEAVLAIEDAREDKELVEFLPFELDTIFNNVHMKRRTEDG